MANRSMNTHRREMRPVTPVGRIGRNAAGAAITASLLVGGAGVALADTDAAPAAPTQGAASDDAANVDAVSTVDASDASKKADAAPKVNTPTAAAPTALAVAPAAPVAKTAAPVALPASADKQSTEDFGDLNSAAISTQVAPPKVEEPAEEATESENLTDDSAKKADKKQKDAKKRADKKKADDKKADKSAKKADKKKAAKKAAKKKSASKSSVSGSSVVSTARRGLGVRYVWGGSTRGGWDCSGFTAWVYRQHGVNLPHSAAAQRSAGRIIPRSQARPGDLVYTPGHIGIYAGNGRIIDAGTSIKTTRERNMWPASWTFVRVGR